MAYISGSNQKYYDKHLKRSVSRTASVSERSYSRFWLNGFSNIWDNNGVHSISDCKNSFEVTAFKRGQNFAKKVIARKR